MKFTRRRVAASLALLGSALALATTVTACRGSSEETTSSEDELSTRDDSAPLMSVEAMIERGKRRDYWPDAEHDWRALDAAAQTNLMTGGSCAELASLLFPAADTDQRTATALGTTVDKLKPEQQALRSDGVIVIKGGKILYEHYVGPYAGHAEKRHCMWSASKSFTAGMMGAIVQSSERSVAGESLPGAKLTRRNRPIGLATPVSELAAIPGIDERVARLTVEDLLSMNLPGPAWNEGYDGNIATSSVVRMLWTEAARDMGQFAASALLRPEPSETTAFRYSSGTAVVLFRALQDLYGADYDRLPWTVLFDRLGMKSAVLERDQKGVFVGSSYAHMTLRDMARFGYAYLNGGYFGGQQVVHPTFVQKAREIGSAMRSPGTTNEEIETEGSFYSMGFWINPNPRVIQGQGIRTFSTTFPATSTNGLKAGSKFFPNTPVDVFFAAGHYGQNIIIFPKDDLMVVRMSHDNEYFSKLDRMMSGARSCFLSASRTGG